MRRGKSDENDFEGSVHTQAFFSRKSLYHRACSRPQPVGSEPGVATAAYVSPLPHRALASLLAIARSACMPYKKRKRGCQTAEEAVNDLAQGCAALTKLLKNVRQRQKYHNELNNASKLSKFMKTVLVLLYVFGGYEVSLAQSFWVHKRKKEKRPALASSTTKRRIEDLFVSYSDDALIILVDSATTPEKRAWRQAVYWQNKMKLRQWVRLQNVQKGVAPSSRMVICQYNRLRKDTPFLLLPGDHPDPSTSSSSRVFLHRWRRAVHGKWKTIRIQEYVSLHDKRRKAGCQNSRSSFPFSWVHV